jgi:hypothetical protein
VFKVARLYDTEEDRICNNCLKRIPEEEDILQYEGKNYCPTCYLKQIDKGTSPGAIVMWIISIFLFICFILLLAF